MGSWISNQGGMSEEERKRRQNLEELLHKMKYSLNVTAKHKNRPSAKLLIFR